MKRETPDRLTTLFYDVGRKDGPDQALAMVDPKDGKPRVVVPQTLQKRLMAWCHTQLVHPGITRLTNTLKQHFAWPTMGNDVKNYLRNCHECQVGKRGVRGYGKVPTKDVETGPWHDMCVDLAGPWKTTLNGRQIKFHCLTIIDPFTS